MGLINLKAAETVDAGLYTLVFNKYDSKVGNDSGNPYFALTFTIDGGKFNGRKLTRESLFTGESEFTAKRWVQFIESFCDASGERINTKDWTDAEAEEFDEVEFLKEHQGETIQASIDHKTGNDGNLEAAIVAYHPLSYAGPALKFRAKQGSGGNKKAGPDNDD